MAEFKISRFRYTWKGSWNTATNYIKDDIVKFGGSSWVCIRQHTSSSFNSDFTYVAPGDTVASPAWTKMTDGFAWRDSWSSATLYSPGDLTLYGGTIYLCVTSHTSSSTFDTNIAAWTIYASSINFRNEWSSNTRYGIGDVVRYSGKVYRCIEGHTSENVENGLEHDLSKWSIYYENVEYKGDYTGSTRYKTNDLVTYNGSLLRCIEGYGSLSTFDDSKWTVEFFGSEFDLEWVDDVYYGIGSVVKHGGFLYYAIQANYNRNPNDSVYQLGAASPAWEILSKGINFRGTWQSSQSYKSGDIVRRGGNLYLSLIDTDSDGSSLDYLDSSNWELLTVGQNWRNSWQESEVYQTNDLTAFKGNVYKCLINHVSDDQNFPDNGSGFPYWDLVLGAGSNVGMSQRGDLLTYDLVRGSFGDQSTFGETGVTIGSSGELLTIDNEDRLFYRNYGSVQRVFYVSINGVDDIENSNRGSSPFLPWRTVRYACEQADDGFSGFTTIRIATGRYEEVLPIIVPARTVVLGDELRSTTIVAKPAISALANDSTYTIAILNRISSVVSDVILGNTIIPTSGNLETQILTPGGSPGSVSDVRDLITDTINYINHYINSTGSPPTMSGTNTISTDINLLNTRATLLANRDFLAEEAVAYMQIFFPGYTFDSDGCRRDVRRYIEAWAYDIVYPGTYKTIYAARYYVNAVLGSEGEDMFYLRDATGLRDCTLEGLNGELNPPNVFDLYRRPTGGSFCSLDPGWGAADERTWINTRSPYIQGVTNIGTGCIGQKIDGSLHNGGNRSMVSNDFTQVISDGIGAWVTNNGRAELVSVFTYYCQVGYLSENGGIIRATNGNNSYGRFGAVADGVDLTEIPRSATVYNRNQQAIVAEAFAGEVNDEILLLEFRHAGENYSSATASFIGSGVNASVVFEDFRDNAIFQSRILDSSTNPAVQNIGGGGYTLVGNNAQVSTPPSIDQTGITIAANDSGEEAEYVGLRIIITSGVGTGQYGIISAYNTGTKVVSVVRESDGQPGWDHVISGTPTQTFLTSTTYRIEPRPIFSAPAYSTSQVDLTASAEWSNIAYGETSSTYTGVAGSAGTGVVIEDDGLEPIIATWNISKQGREYTVTLNNPGAGYEIGQTVTILGTAVEGDSPRNDITVTVTGTTEDSTNAITTFTYTGIATSGRFVAVSQNSSNAFAHSDNGVDWETGNLPSSGDWKCIAAGNNRFVAIRNNSAAAASSTNGILWTARTMPASRNWNSVAYGNGRFVAVAGNLNSAAYSTNGTTWTASTMPTIGDSTINEWVDITYGKGKFVAIANSGNISAESVDGITWIPHVMDVVDDSSQKDWVSVTYGNNRYVAVTSTGEVAYSFDAATWYSAEMPKADGSTAHYWRQIRYGQGVFFAIGDTGSRVVGADTTTGPSVFAATSPDGILWTPRLLEDEQEWRAVAFGNPYTEAGDSSEGKSTPMWIAVATGSQYANKIQTGATAKGRVVTTAGVISEIKLWDPGSGYIDDPTLTIIDPNNTSDAVFENRLGDGVLANPSWLNRGNAYRTSTTQVTISGNGFADIIPFGRFVTLSDLTVYPGPGAQIIFSGNDQIYTAVTIEELGTINGGQAARIRISPELRVRDNLYHGISASIREIYSQCRITGHDFLDIGTGNFEETNYPELYATGLYTPAPENEVVEEDGGRIFYTATDQSGNFRAGELFAVEQATGVVTISADFFDLQGLSELALGGVRLGGSGAVIREFSTDPLFTEDSNNVIPTQRAIRAYLNNRLTVGGSEIATSSFIAGTVRVGPTFISNTASLKINLPKRMDFVGADCQIYGSILAQTMFFRSFSVDN